MKVALIQMDVVQNKVENLRRAEYFIHQACQTERPDWILLPETFTWIGGTNEDKRKAAETFPLGEAYALIQNMAQQYQVFIHAGSMLEASPEATDLYNTSCVFNRKGQEIARYRKIHLFDVVVPSQGQDQAYRESELIAPGNEIIVYDVEGIVFGCAICYDLRFPALFQALVAQGAYVMVLPAAFTLETGKDHWEVLCRARAIETQSYFCGAAQSGSFSVSTPHGIEIRRTYGHSLVVDPWGQVTACSSDGPNIIYAHIDRERVTQIRMKMPRLPRVLE